MGVHVSGARADEDELAGLISGDRETYAEAFENPGEGVGEFAAEIEHGHADLGRGCFRRARRLIAEGDGGAARDGFELREDRGERGFVASPFFR